MPSSCKLALQPEAIRFTPADAVSRPVFLYEGAKRTDVRKVDAQGNPVGAFEATIEISGQRFGKARIESGQQLPQDVPLGTLFRGAGDVAELRIFNQRDGFDLRIVLVLGAFATSDLRKS